MSIKTEIDRIANAKTSIRNAIQGKGVDVPAATSLDDYGSYVNSIPQISELEEIETLSPSDYVVVEKSGIKKITVSNFAAIIKSMGNKWYGKVVTAQNTAGNALILPALILKANMAVGDVIQVSLKMSSQDGITGIQGGWIYYRTGRTSPSSTSPGDGVSDKQSASYDASTLTAVYSATIQYEVTESGYYAVVQMPMLHSKIPASFTIESLAITQNGTDITDKVIALEGAYSAHTVTVS